MDYKLIVENIIKDIELGENAPANIREMFLDYYSKDSPHENIEDGFRVKLIGFGHSL